MRGIAPAVTKCKKLRSGAEFFVFVKYGAPVFSYSVYLFLLVELYVMSPYP